MLRLIVLFILIGCSVAASGQTDSLLIADGFEEQELGKVLRKLRKSYDLQFAYDHRALSKVMVKLEPGRRSAEELLRKLLEGSGYSYRQLSGVYVITPAKETPEQAGRGMLSGQVFDLRSGESLPFTSIQIAGSRKSYIANQEGSFMLEGMEQDTLKLIFRFTGYEPATFTLGPNDSRNKLRIYLSPFISTLPEAKVVEQTNLPIAIETMPSINSIGVHLSSRTGNAGIPDPFRPLQLVSGVDATTESNAGLVIRGASADQLLILFDGFTVYHVDHLYGVFSAFNPESIKHMRLHKGAFESRLGDRNSGVLEITGKEGNRYNSRVSAGLNFIGADVSAELPAFANKGSVVFTARRSFTDIGSSFLFREVFNTVYNSSILQSNNQTDAFSQGNEPLFYFYDLTARASYEPGDSDKLNISVYHGRDQLELGYNDPSPGIGNTIEYNDFSNWGNTGISGKWNHKWNDRNQTTLVLAYSRYRSELDTRDIISNSIINQSDTLFTEQSSLLEDRSLRLNHETNYSGHKISTGIWVSARTVDYRFDAIGAGESAFLIQQGNSVAVYAQDELSVGERWKVNAGVRLGYSDLAAELRGEPRLGMSYALSRKVRVKGGLGFHHQDMRRIRRQNLFLNTPDVWRLANLSSIPILSSVQMVGGLAGECGWLVWDVEAYYRESDGEILDPLNLRLGQEEEYLVGEGQAYGLDLMFRKDEGRWKFNLAYSLSESVMRFEGIHQNQWIYSPNDLRHQLKLFQSYRWKNWEFSTTFIYGSGSPYTPALGLYDVELLNGNMETYAAFGLPYSGRLPEYHRLDLNAAYVFKLWGARAEAGFSVYNTYNRANVRNRTYFLEEINSSSRLVPRDLYMLGILPGVHFRITWE